MRFLLLLLVFLSGKLFAQIPNPGFESWVAGNWQLEPEGWTTSNGQVLPAVTQDNDSYEGIFAMRVDAVNDGLGAYGWAECTIPIDYIPSSLDFYVKAGTEFGSVNVSISFWNNEFLFNSFEWNSGSSIDEWTYISIPMEQNEPVLTHAVIQVDAIVGDLVAGTAWISVDAMGFDGTLSDEQVVVNKDIQIYPNPAADRVNIQNFKEVIDYVSIYDNSGKLVEQKRANKSYNQIDVSQLPVGTYLMVATLENGKSISKKLLIVR